MRKRGLLVGVVSAVAAVVGATGLVSTADAVHVVCGQVITQNTTLDTNLIGCTNNGIVIGADNITLNLAGRTVSGTGVPGDGAGILAVGRTGVTIAGGVVSGFDGGVVIQGGARNTVRQVVVQDNVGRINDPVLPNTPYADGILILDSSNNQVLNNQALRNGPLSGIGLRGNSDNNLVQGNLSESNRALLSGPSPESSLVDDMGYRLDGIGERLPNFNLLQFNNARNNGQDGFSLFTGANDNRLVGNISTSNGFDGPEHFRGSGIKMHHDTRRTYVTGNNTRLNALHGIFVAPTILFPLPPLENQIIRNTSLNNEQFSPLVIGYDLIDGNPFCDDDTWLQNVHFTENFPGSDCIS